MGGETAIKSITKKVEQIDATPEIVFQYMDARAEVRPELIQLANMRSLLIASSEVWAENVGSSLPIRSPEVLTNEMIIGATGQISHELGKLVDYKARYDRLYRLNPVSYSTKDGEEKNDIINTVAAALQYSPRDDFNNSSLAYRRQQLMQYSYALLTAGACQFLENYGSEIAVAQIKVDRHSLKPYYQITDGLYHELAASLGSLSYRFYVRELEKRSYKNAVNSIGGLLGTVVEILDIKKLIKDGPQGVTCNYNDLCFAIGESLFKELDAMDIPHTEQFKMSEDEAHKLKLRINVGLIARICKNVIQNIDRNNSAAAEPKSTEKKISHVGTSIFMREKDNRSYLIVSIQDDGSGWDQEILNDGFKFGLTKRSDGVGNGVGLAFIRMIIEKILGGMFKPARVFGGEGAALETWIPLD